MVPLMALFSSFQNVTKNWSGVLKSARSSDVSLLNPKSVYIADSDGFVVPSPVDLRRTQSSMLVGLHTDTDDIDDMGCMLLLIPRRL